MNENSAVKRDSTPSVVPNAEPLQAPADGSSESSRSVGQLLRVAREKAGVSLGDVASRLRMGIKQVRALEQDNYAALPTGTFLRGFVRNFAKEVGVVPDVALRLLAETNQSAIAINASAVIMPSQQNISVLAPGGEFSTPRARAFIVVAIATLVAAVIWYWWGYVRPHRADGGRPKIVNEETAVSVPIALPQPTGIVAPPEAVALPEGTAPLPVGPVGVSQLSAETSEIAPAVPRPVLPAGSGLLGFSFSGDSWVQVVDRTEKTVLDRKFKNGETEEVIGRAPFSVVIGNASVTRMAFNGKEIDLVPHTRGVVARIAVK